MNVNRICLVFHAHVLFSAIMAFLVAQSRLGVILSQ